MIGVIGNKLYPVMAILGVLISAAVYRVHARRRPVGPAAALRRRRPGQRPGSLRVNLVHVLPSMATVVAVQAAQLFGIGLLIVAGLAFLGFGPAEPEPSWGFMIQDASGHMFDAPWLMVPTGLVLALTVVAANELADAIAGTGHGASSVAGAGGAAPPSVAAAGRDGRLRADADEARSSRSATCRSPSTTARRWSPASRSRLRPGRVLGLVGESGCGKTMTARSLMGLLPDGVVGLRRVDPLAGPRARRPVGEGARPASAAGRSR